MYAVRKSEDTEKMKTRAERAENLLWKMRHDFLWELDHLWEQIHKREIERYNFEYIDIRFFDPTEGLPEDICVLLNNWVEMVQTRYNMLLNEMRMNYEACMKQVNFYDTAHPDLILKMKEATCDTMVWKLAIIEKNPRVVWRAIEEYFGEDFFKKIIEVDYGISDEKLQWKMESELEYMRKKTLLEMDKAGKVFQAENNRLKDEVQTLRDELE